MIGRQHSHHSRRGTPIIVRRPFWLPASNYYVLAAAVSAAFFFLAWGIGHDQGEETPWITAGIGASIILGSAVVVRFVLLRNMRERYARIEPGLAQKYTGGSRQVRRRGSGNKFTLERNAAILGEIKKKSDAADVLGKFSAGHREVFELCSEYINRTESELKNIAADSPRLTALLKGRKSASNFHRYHMLQWAEIEARTLTGEANSQTNLEDKIKAAKDALGVIDFALATYPAERNLVESRELLSEMIVSIKVSDWVEKAERAAFKGDYREAVGLYRDALFYLGRDNVHSEQRQQAADHINGEIDRMRLLESGE